MSSSLLLAAVVSGVLSGASLLLPTLATAIAYQHGRYIPLWLPDLGVLGAYVVHALWTRGLGGVVSLIVAATLATVLSWFIHRRLIGPVLNRDERLSPLLVGLGLSQMFQAVVSTYGEGMSQHFPRSIWNEGFYSSAIGAAVYWVELGFVIVAGAVVLFLHFYLHHTNWGTKVRMVFAHASDARKLGLPVLAIDRIVLATAAIVMTVGVLMRGIRFDLQPAMMFYPGLSVLTACIVAQPGRRIASLGIVVGIEVVAAVVGVMPGCSMLQRAIPLAVLLLVLIGRGIRDRARANPRGPSDAGRRLPVAPRSLGAPS